MSRNVRSRSRSRPVRRLPSETFDDDSDSDRELPSPNSRSPFARRRPKKEPEPEPSSESMEETMDGDYEADAELNEEDASESQKSVEAAKPRHLRRKMNATELSRYRSRLARSRPRDAQGRFLPTPHPRDKKRTARFGVKVPEFGVSEDSDSEDDDDDEKELLQEALNSTLQLVNIMNEMVHPGTNMRTPGSLSKNLRARFDDATSEAPSPKPRIQRQQTPKARRNRER